LKLDTKLTLAVSAILAVALTIGAWVIWRNMDIWATERFRAEMATVAGYTQEVRLHLAVVNSCLEQDRAVLDTLSVPVAAAWNTVRHYAESQGYEFRVAALAPRNPERTPDAFERKALEVLSRDPKRTEFAAREERGDEEVMRFAVPVRIESDCLPCHGGPEGDADSFGYPREGLKLGDLRGVFVISAPLASLREAQQGMRRTFVVTGMGAILMAAFAVFLTIHRFTRPLDTLAQAALRLGEGELDQRVRIHTNDEVGLLATAFNRMAQSLQGYQDTLEQKVEERSRELEASQQQLMQAGKLASIGELASGVAHELNNPASIILMRANRLSEEIEQRELSAEAREDVQVIEHQVEKISRIVSGLLTFSRRSTSAKRPINCNDVVRRTVPLIEDMARHRGVELGLELDAFLPLVEADSAQLEQVMLNLINNALDAMPEGGRIIFRSDLVEEPGLGKLVRIEVEDTGDGIPEEHLSRVFDPFFTTKEVGQGTGLGLSISYGIMEEHGGSIRVDSRPGEGVCFKLYLPVMGEIVSQPSTDKEDSRHGK